ncbi:hypothetical protein CesoFtcFv8_009637 [Champsocephalus esox]|uniref:Uncharacterized protein n=1 Tax=Champsocephalus esox TaxID=159716 RepID=A0AAN8C383_9TELE|nr:hypothetical protein CesoFtcFv8_009637 [Champsocephalus esox]
MDLALSDNMDLALSDTDTSSGFSARSDDENSRSPCATSPVMKKRRGERTADPHPGSPENYFQPQDAMFLRAFVPPVY